MLPAFRANSLCWRSKVVKRSRVIPGAFASSAKVVITNRFHGSGITAAEAAPCSQSGRRRRSHQTTKRRRWRRIIANS